MASFDIVTPVLTALDSLSRMSGWPVYVVVGALVFLESAAFVGLVLPGETALLVAGVMAAGGRVSIGVLLPLAAVMAIAGDSVGYGVGRLGGPRLRGSALGRRVPEASWDRTERLLARRGMFAVIGARWVGVLRALVPTFAGMVRMPWRAYLLANVVGGLVWSVAVTLLGYTAGTSLVGAHGLLRTISIVTGGGLLLTASGVAIRLARRHVVKGTVGSDPDKSRARDRRGTRWGHASLTTSRAGAAGALAAVLAIGTAASIAIGDSAAEGDDLARLDRPIAAALAPYRVGPGIQIADAVTTVGSEPVLAVMALVLMAIAGALSRSWWTPVMAGATAAGAVGLTWVIKWAVARPRPLPATGLLPETGYSFPSGHTLGCTVVFGLGAYLAVTRLRNRRTALGVAAVCITVPVVVGASRVFLGYHWTSDVLGGWVVGATWLTAVIGVERTVAAGGFDARPADPTVP
ncbi:bifunctional DedA family/phosphatase PAP2 family protein [Pedococcus sp. NPDC057267]|uniref:bifunctional DedA family/phosphatase PAP2 family protein n=1 Tax=Pedococcus sp. NPDC057267 TaxID=3346077 RepID=UPI003642E4D9